MSSTEEGSDAMSAKNDVSNDQVLVLAFCIALKKLKEEAPDAFGEIDFKMAAVVSEVRLVVSEEKKG